MQELSSLYMYNKDTIESICPRERTFWDTFRNTMSQIVNYGTFLGHMYKERPLAFDMLPPRDDNGLYHLI